MDLIDRVLMITFMNGVSIPVEGRMDDLPPAPGLFVFRHATIGDKIAINIDNVMNIMEVPRSSVRTGQNKIIDPGGRLN
jgi:hypothetical protein